MEWLHKLFLSERNFDCLFGLQLFELDYFQYCLPKIDLVNV